MKHVLVATVALTLCLSGGCRKEPPRENVLSAKGQGDTAAVGGGVSGSGGSGMGGSSGTGGDMQDAEVVLRNDAGDPIIDASLDAGDFDASVPPPPPFSKADLVQAFADCAMQQYDDFHAKTEALVVATEALAASPGAGTLATAQDAFRNAMRSWQRAEVFGFGPAARSSEPGGRNLRDEIYLYPLGNACLVDQQIVNKAYDGASFASSLGSGRGLTALEYLLFHTDSTNACLAAITINKNGTWAALDAEELGQRRADYAAAVATDVRARAKALAQAWDPAHGDFEHSFTHAGGSSPYAAQTDALTAVSDALFYIDLEVKDYKLGWPLGLVSECINAPSPCPTAVESRYAQTSTDHLRQNLIAARKVFEGCGTGYWGLGFDDWLIDVGEEELAQRMLEALQAAQAEVDALDPKLEQAIFESPPSKVAAVHAAVKAFTNLLKTEFVTMLNIELPDTAQGDND
jgi:uncharacterized protein